VVGIHCFRHIYKNNKNPNVYWDFIFFCVTISNELDYALDKVNILMYITQFISDNPDLRAHYTVARDSYERETQCAR